MGRQQLAPLDLRAVLRLAGSAGAPGEVLTSQGPSAPPAWAAPGTPADGSITLAKLANLTTQRVIGRNTAGSGVPEEVSLSQLLDWASSTPGAVIYRGASEWQGLAPPANVFQFMKATTSGIEWYPMANLAFVSDGLGQFEPGSSTASELRNLLVPASVAGGGAVLFAEFSHDAITYAATVDLDMAALSGRYRTISLTGNLTLTSSNRETGRTVTLRLIADASTRTLTFPAGWVFLGDPATAKPADIAANKTGVLSLSFFGTADSDCVAAWSVQG